MLLFKNLRPTGLKWWHVFYFNSASRLPEVCFIHIFVLPMRKHPFCILFKNSLVKIPSLIYDCQIIIIVSWMTLVTCLEHQYISHTLYPDSFIYAGWGNSNGVMLPLTFRFELFCYICYQPALLNLRVMLLDNWQQCCKMKFSIACFFPFRTIQSYWVTIYNVPSIPF